MSIQQTAAFSWRVWTRRRYQDTTDLGSVFVYEIAQHPKTTWLLAIAVATLLVQPTSAHTITGRVVGVVDADTITGMDAGQAQLAAGLAWWYPKYLGEQPPEDRVRD
jgi:hypothetical protein